MISSAWRSAFGSVYFAILGVLYLPMLAVAVYAFFPQRRGQADFGAPTLQFFVELMQNKEVLDAVRTSAIVAVVATAIVLVVATVYALLLENVSAFTRRTFETFIYAPFFVPPIIVGLSLLLASTALNVPRGLPLIVLGHALFTLGVVYRLVSVRLSALPRSQIEAARDLGASSWQIKRYIVFPHMWSALVASGLLSMLLSFDETLITALVSGNTTTLPLRLWAMMRLGFSPDINALVVLVVVGLFILALLAYLAFRQSDTFRG